MENSKEYLKEIIITAVSVNLQISQKKQFIGNRDSANKGISCPWEKTGDKE